MQSICITSPSPGGTLTVTNMIATGSNVIHVQSMACDGEDNVNAIISALLLTGPTVAICNKHHYERELQLTVYFWNQPIVITLGVEFEDVHLGNNPQSYSDVKSASPDETTSIEGVVAGTIVLGHAAVRNLVE